VSGGASLNAGERTDDFKDFLLILDIAIIALWRIYDMVLPY